MRRVAWFLHVVPRTARAFLPALAVPDDAFARDVLSDAEFGLYLRMDRRDRHHGVVVARAVLALDPDAPDVVLRAALLHDVGKSVAPYRAWERIGVHLWARLGGAGLGRSGERPDGATGVRGRLREAWRRHLRHPERGAELVLEAGGDPAVADLVARHHDGHAPDEGAALLARADEAR